MVFQDPEGHPTRGAGGTGIVEDYLIFGVERLERFLDRADTHRAGDVRDAILPLAQGHDKRDTVPPSSFAFNSLVSMRSVSCIRQSPFRPRLCAQALVPYVLFHMGG